MQEDNQQTSQYVQNPQPRTDIGFPSGGTKENWSKSSIVKWVFVIVGIFLIAIAGVWYVFNSSMGSGGTSPSPTSSSELRSFATLEPEVEPTPSPTPEPISKSDIRINILNGTGKAGEASFLKGELEDAGYENIEIANAPSQDETRTTATFSEKVGQDEVDEITKILEDIYETVRVRKSEISGDFDIEILTGPRKKSEASSSTKSPSPSPSLSPSPSPSQ